LRNLAQCPVEMNLMPDSTLRWRTLNEKKPYFIATVAALVGVAFAVGLLFQKLAESKSGEIATLQPKVDTLSAKTTRFTSVYNKLKSATSQADQITTWMEERYYWGDVLAQLRGALIRSEDDIKKKLSAQKPGVEAGVWIEQMTTMSNLAGGPPSMPSPDAPQPPPDQNQQAGGSGTPSNTITLVCRAVSLSNVDPSANSEIAYAVESQLKNCPIFDPKTTALAGNITPDEATGTFTFGVTVTLQNPLKL